MITLQMKQTVHPRGYATQNLRILSCFKTIDTVGIAVQQSFNAITLMFVKRISDGPYKQLKW